jgi:hypothetical protein
MRVISNEARYNRAHPRPILNAVLALALTFLALGGSCRPGDPIGVPGDTPPSIPCENPIQCEPHIPPCTMQFGCSDGACFFVPKCAEGQKCIGEECCTPACTGRQCGDDRCGGSCGACAAPKVCDASGQCVCVPNCNGKQCGDDGCGGSCGACAEPADCTRSGQCCAPHCQAPRCGEDDGCGDVCRCGPGEACCRTGLGGISLCRTGGCE